MSRLPRRPERADLQAAAGGALEDILEPGLTILFCGINPSLYSVAVGHHFARPGNRFWPALHRAGFTDRQLLPSEDRLLLGYGYGLTNVVARGTAAASELSAADYLRGGEILAEKLRRFSPRWLAVLGVEAYRRAFARPGAIVGSQRESLEGTQVWVLPNPSGLNAHYQLPALAATYAELWRAVRTTG